MTDTLHSINEYDYTGQSDFVAPSHQQASDIVVLVNDVVKTQGTDYTLTGSLVVFDTGFTPSNGDKISIRRETASATRAVDFASGSMLKAETLDKDSNQIFFMAQEALDKADRIAGDYNARYFGSSAVAPTSASVGDLWFDTSVNTMKVYRTDSGWQPTTSSVSNAVRRAAITLTTSQSTFSGGSYDIGNIDIYLNGVKLVARLDANTPNDYTADDGTTFTLTTPAAAGDTLEVITYGTSPLLDVQTGAAGTDASYSLSEGKLTIPRGDTGANGTDASVTTANVTAAGAAMLTGATFTGDVTFNEKLEFQKGSFSSYPTIEHWQTSVGGSSINGLVIDAIDRLDIKSDVYTNLKSLGNRIRLYGGGGHKFLECKLDDDGLKTTILYHGNTIETLRTTSDGINVTGNVTTTGTLSTGDYTLSSTDGTSGQALVTDGSGNVSFGDVTVDVSGKANLSGADFTGDVTTTGNVGIGTTSPARALHVNAGTANEVARFESTDTACLVEFKDTTGTASVETRNDFRFSAGGSERLRIASSGNVGIGTTSPTEALDVVGNIAVSGTVDGRDIAADGTKLDTLDKVIKRNALFLVGTYSLGHTEAQWGSYTYVGGHTSPHNVEATFDIKSTNFTGSNANGDINMKVAMTVPTGTITPFNLGTCTNVSGSQYSLTIAVDGDITPYLSDFCGISDNAAGTGTLAVPNRYMYNTFTGKTEISMATYQKSGYPTGGETVYLHPYNWESANTIITSRNTTHDVRGYSVQQHSAINMNLGAITLATIVTLRAFENYGDNTQLNEGYVSFTERKI